MLFSVIYKGKVGCLKILSRLSTPFESNYEGPVLLGFDTFPSI